MKKISYTELRNLNDLLEDFTDVNNDVKTSEFLKLKIKFHISNIVWETVSSEIKMSILNNLEELCIKR
jgi:hypothetical protein